MTSLPERDMTLLFPELEANMSVQEQELGCLEGANWWEEACPLWEGVWKRERETWRQPASRGIAGAEVFASLGAPPLAWQQRSALGGARLFGAPEATRRKRCLPSTDCFPWLPSCSSCGIYEYRNGHQEVESPFQGRLQWNGSKDLQDVSITVLNVTLNDSGLYTCNVSREFEFEAHRPFVKTTRLIPLRVTEEAGEDFTSVVSEIMMYILLVFLTLWLLIEMIYCYRKVSKAEEAAQENASDYLAIPSENKENSAVPVEE
nr:sodium channel subunit beta-3 isoform X1 [Vicugna pacos]XP_015099565.1 sodium channel subunit beta-3 isoform X1 [Vicugna pacos]